MVHNSKIFYCLTNVHKQKVLISNNDPSKEFGRSFKDYLKCFPKLLNFVVEKFALFYNYSKFKPPVFELCLNNRKKFSATKFRRLVNNLKDYFRKTAII